MAKKLTKAQRVAKLHKGLRKYWADVKAGRRTHKGRRRKKKATSHATRTSTRRRRKRGRPALISGDTIVGRPVGVDAKRRAIRKHFQAISVLSKGLPKKKKGKRKWTKSSVGPGLRAACRSPKFKRLAG